MNRKETLAFVEALKKLRETVTDEQAVVAQAVYPTCKSNTIYKADERVLYNHILYKVITAHTSQDAWTPTDTPSLFAQILIPDNNVIPNWIQPDSTNPYIVGDKVVCDGKVWISIVNNNVWKPGEYGWEEVN